MSTPSLSFPDKVLFTENKNLTKSLTNASAAYWDLEAVAMVSRCFGENSVGMVASFPSLVLEPTTRDQLVAGALGTDLSTRVCS